MSSQVNAIPFEVSIPFLVVFEMTNVGDTFSTLRSLTTRLNHVDEGAFPQGPVPVDYAKLLVQFEQLKAEYHHLIKCHWFPLQRLAAGVISSLYIYAGEEPGSPSFGGECDCQLPAAEPSVPVGPGNSPPTPDSLPELESLSSSEESSPVSGG